MRCIYHLVRVIVRKTAQNRKAAIAKAEEALEVNLPRLEYLVSTGQSDSLVGRVLRSRIKIDREILSTPRNIRGRNPK